MNTVVHLPGPATHRTPMASVQGALALDLTPRLDPPSPGGEARVGADVVLVAEEVRGRLEAWARRYLQAAVEIACGDRPISQLLRWTEAGVYEDLARRAVLVARAGGVTTGNGRPRGAVRPVLVGVHTCFVRDDAVEASAHVRYGRRSRAVAARFEVRRERWQCVALEFA